MLPGAPSSPPLTTPGRHQRALAVCRNAGRGAGGEVGTARVLRETEARRWRLAQAGGRRIAERGRQEAPPP